MPMMDDDGKIQVELTFDEIATLWTLVQSDRENLDAGGYSFLGEAWEHAHAEKLRVIARKLSVIKPDHDEVDGSEFIRAGW